jgi:hypothetical protein
MHVDAGHCHAQPPQADFKWPRVYSTSSCGLWQGRASTPADAGASGGVGGELPLRVEKAKAKNK